MTSFGPLEELRLRAIPDLAEARLRRKGFRTKVPLDRQAPQFGEPLVEALSLGLAGENYYYSPRNPPYWRRIEGSVPDLMVRRSVGEKLAQINALLAVAELELYVFDAWRPRAVQVY